MRKITQFTAKLGVACLVSCLAISFTMPASAAKRESTKSYSCSGLKKVIRHRGATVMNTKNAHVYDRLVSNRSYCQYEEITRRMLKKYARREEIVVATKLGLIVGDGPNQKGLSRKHIIESVNSSLKRLQMDHVDLLYVHRLDPLTPFEELLEALDVVVRAGIRKLCLRVSV